MTRQGQEGQTMAEVGVVLAVVSLATLAVLTAFGGSIQHAILRAASLF
jgi:Flp pilus assembly pilin Flp